jgi:trk system potassium uptake protein TrkH
MRLRTIFHISAINCLFLAGAFALCALYATVCGDEPRLAWIFGGAAAGVVALGGAVWGITRGEDEPTRRDGFAIVVLGWLLICGLGALPYRISGVTPTLAGAVYESVSGFTTTGGTVLTALENLPRSILFYRSLSQLMGGMGILVMVIAILPFIKGGAFQIYQAEVSGPSKDRLAPQIVSTAKLTCGMFLGMWVIAILLLLAGGLPFLDAFTAACGSVSTGGFSNRTASLGAYDSLYVEAVCCVFMLLGAINFGLHYAFLRGDRRAYFNNEECRVYLLVVAGVTLSISLNLWQAADLSYGRSLRDAFFAVVTVSSTAGFATEDFNQWPDFSRLLLVGCMVTCACSGSTAGGLKFVRIILIWKVLMRELRRLLHPQAVYKVKLGERFIDDTTLAGVCAFFVAYMLVIAGASIALTFFSPDLTTAVTAVISALGNVGPGLGAVGPAGDYSVIAPAGQWILSLLMLLGRLEIFSFFVLLSPDFWKK